ncbi:alpha/beta fold hydrolase [Haliea sp. E17]|uniref:alpha/beta fold hydrolase n=1 Tax=Haliea sp. E17 TaxID=3401576 RepID=UPI003AAB6017
MIERCAPIAVDPETFIADLEARGRRFATSCGEGVLVWRCWGSGPPLLLAHGAGGSWLHWVHTIDALAQHYTVWAVDLPGYGESDLPPEPTQKAISSVLAEGLVELTAAALPLDVVGFSFGGVASAYLARYFPELVRRLVLVDTGGLDTPRGEVDLLGVRGLDAEGRIAVNRHNLLQLMLHAEDSVDALALCIQALVGTRSRLNPIPLVLPDRLLQVLPKLTLPVDCIWGELDQPHPNPTAQEEVLRRFFPQMQFRVIAGAGHWVMYERPAAFNAALLEILAPGKSP